MNGDKLEEECVTFRGRWLKVEKKLVLKGKGIKDVTEIEGISDLTKLIELDLRNNEITEIQGIEGLGSLTILRLSKNKIQEISGLDNLKRLEVLDLRHNEIKEIKGLSDLIALEKLDLRHNQIKKIAGLDNLVSLRELDLGYNLIFHVEECVRYPLIKFNFVGNPMEDPEAVPAAQVVQAVDTFSQLDGSTRDRGSVFDSGRPPLGVPDFGPLDPRAEPENAPPSKVEPPPPNGDNRKDPHALITYADQLNTLAWDTKEDGLYRRAAKLWEDALKSLTRARRLAQRSDASLIPAIEEKIETVKSCIDRVKRKHKRRS